MGRNARFAPIKIEVNAHGGSLHEADLAVNLLKIV